MNAVQWWLYDTRNGIDNAARDAGEWLAHKLLTLATKVHRGKDRGFARRLLATAQWYHPRPRRLIELDDDPRGYEDGAMS